jgi:uncharacterized membrane protein YqjE
MDKEPSDIGTKFKSISTDIQAYIEKRLELFTLTASEQLSTVLADSLMKFTGILFIAFGGLIMWFALAFALAELFESTPLGFLIAGIPLILIGLVFLKFELKSLKNKIKSGFILEALKIFDETADKITEESNGEKSE